MGMKKFLASLFLIICSVAVPAFAAETSRDTIVITVDGKVFLVIGIAFLLALFYSIKKLKDANKNTDGG